MRNLLLPILMIAVLFNNAAILHHHFIYVSFFYFLLNLHFLICIRRIVVCHMGYAEYGSVCDYNTSSLENITYFLHNLHFILFMVSATILCILLLLILSVFLSNFYSVFIFGLFPFYVKILYF